MLSIRFIKKREERNAEDSDLFSAFSLFLESAASLSLVPQMLKKGVIDKNKFIQ